MPTPGDPPAMAPRVRGWQRQQWLYPMQTIMIVATLTAALQVQAQSTTQVHVVFEEVNYIPHARRK